MSITKSLKRMTGDLFGRIRQRRILCLIARLAKPDDYDSLNALVKIGQPAVEPLIGALNDPAVRKGAIMALGRIGDKRALEPLIALLYDKDIGQYAAFSLVLMGDRSAVKPLLELAWNEKDDPCDMNLPFIDALGSIGDANALRTLESWHELVQRQYESTVEGESDILVKQWIYETMAPCLEGLERSIVRMRKRQGQI